MPTEVGVFQSRAAASNGIERLLQRGVNSEKVTLLTPDSTEREVAAVPVSDTEQPGMGAAVGSVVGGALGTAGGFGAGAAIASLLVPGVGSILAGGLAGAGLLGLSGAAGGAAAGDLMEKRIAGLPHDELFVYEDALRQGRTVVFVEVEDEMSAEAVRQGFAEGGAETVDAARERWWIGLRSAEKESYSVDGGNFERDEVYHRKGFEAALSPGARGKTYEEAHDYLTRVYHISADDPAFRRGFERGREHHESFLSKLP